MLRLLPANIASNCSCEFLQRVQQACIAVLFAVWAGESITRSHTGISVALMRMGLGSVLWVACLRYQRESDRRYVSCGDTRPRTLLGKLIGLSDANYQLISELTGHGGCENTDQFRQIALPVLRGWTSGEEQDSHSRDSSTHSISLDASFTTSSVSKLTVPN